jgi:hypothetical protein
MPSTEDVLSHVSRHRWWRRRSGNCGGGGGGDEDAFFCVAKAPSFTTLVNVTTRCPAAVTIGDPHTAGGCSVASGHGICPHAVGYAICKGVKNGALLMRLKTKNSLERGAELTCLSVFPGKAETLYPSLTFMQARASDRGHQAH